MGGALEAMGERQEVRTHLPFDADPGVRRLNVHVNQGGVHVSVGAEPVCDFGAASPKLYAVYANRMLLSAKS